MRRAPARDVIKIEPLTHGRQTGIVRATFFKNGGDCEDFAMAKFKLLEKIGFHPARMRIVLVLDQERNRQHAVLAVNEGGEAWMLDSLIRDVKPHQLADHYRPTVSLSGPRLYLHIAPKT